MAGVHWLHRDDSFTAMIQPRWEGGGRQEVREERKEVECFRSESPSFVTADWA